MKIFLTTLIIAGSLILNSTTINAQCITAIQLDGVDDYLWTPFSNYTFANYTIEMWINSADYLANEMYVSIRQNKEVILGGWAVDGSFTNSTAGLMPLQANSGPGSVLSPGSWHHVALVYNGSERIYYIDGIMVATIPTTGSLVTNSAYAYGLTIGANWTGGGQYTNTAFEDVRIWETARTQTEINANVVSNLTGNEPGLLAYYRFDDGVGSTTVTDLTGNGNDLTLMNVNPATAWVPGIFSTNVQTTDVIDNCGPLTWIDGTTYTSNNNSAQYTFTGGAVGGCDSIVSLDLTVNTPVDTTTSTNMSVITSNETSLGTQYQWIDCNNNNTQISGEIGQTFTATTTGSYAVIVSGTNGCSDTSECVQINTISLNESSFESEFTISPNPTSGELSISTLNYSGELSIEVRDLTGKLIFNSLENLDQNSTVSIDLSEFANGVYIVNVSDQSKSHSVRIIKK